ncbi:MAG: hypothetical protein BGO43_05545 [Gammaproteobacteria bacterium 39-13]|nr:MAG: hypothetical protein BGO43_05545 [Gammaproteobacteria bacterium 39-13]
MGLATEATARTISKWGYVARRKSTRRRFQPLTQLSCANDFSVAEEGAFLRFCVFRGKKG